MDDLFSPAPHGVHPDLPASLRMKLPNEDPNGHATTWGPGARRPGFFAGTRSRVLGMTVALAFLTYMDRVCISVTAPSIQHDLTLTSIQMGFVFSAFTATYALFEIPTGWWADRRGSRHVLTRIVLWWSVFTGLTGGAWNFQSLILLRGLFGAGEAGAWPTVARALSRWFPTEERGTAQGIFFMGAHLGGGCTPLAVAAIASVCGWRFTFPVLSVLGFAWAFVWLKWYRDEPRDFASIDREELAWIESHRKTVEGSSHKPALIRAALRSQSVWALCLLYFAQTYGFNFYVTWFPTYIRQAKGLEGPMLAVCAGLPLLLSVPADLCGGMFTDFLTRNTGLRLGRCLIGATCFAAASGCLLIGPSLRGVACATLIAFGAAFSNCLLGACWSTCSDIAGDHAAVISATMNTCGQIGGVLSPVLFAILSKRSGDWNTPLYLTAALYALGAACWYFVHPEKPLLSPITTEC